MALYCLSFLHLAASTYQAKLALVQPSSPWQPPNSHQVAAVAGGSQPVVSGRLSVECVRACVFVSDIIKT